MRRVLVVNGPNLDLLGIREPHLYGTTTLAELEQSLTEWGEDLGLEVDTFQSNHEGALVERIHQARNEADGIVINPAALTHYSRSLADALVATDLPTVEVHISNIAAREVWRRESVVSPSAVHTIFGRGLPGYRWALRHLVYRHRAPAERLAYGMFPDQFGDLRRPHGDGKRLVILLHGGLWLNEWTRDITDGMAVDLTNHGYVTWNLEYRRVGAGGGWPESFVDVAAALTAAPDLVGIGPDDTIIAGHSAGGTMALWSTGLNQGRPPTMAVGMAALTDLVRAENENIGDGAIRRLLGRQRPDPSLYSPFHRLPTNVPVLLAATAGDRLIPFAHGQDFAAAAVQAGDRVEFLEVVGTHGSFMDPASDSWKELAGLLR
ncbi:MAG: type II 3-dehydroquinate dehydratase, partial [Acidimicrobiia bacterium]